MNALEIHGLSKHFDGFDLEDISFELPKGYIMGYVGQNGAGKTTTINLITHLLSADSGEILINGLSYKSDPVKYKEAIGFIGDESYFPPDFTLADVKKVLKDFYSTFNEDTFDSMISRLKLPYKKAIKDYSRGMSVRLMFASIMCRETSLLILDEATNGLDPVVRAEVLDLLQEYVQDGNRSVLFSTHIINDLDKISDFIFFINDGRKVLCDEKDTLLENYVIVKGGPDELSDGLKEHAIYVKNTPVGFEALLNSDDITYANSSCVTEKPCIDQIVINFISAAERR